MAFDPLAPESVTLPAVSGVARQGETLACSTGTWRNGTATFSSAWLRDGTPIAGATAATYAAADGDLDAQIACRVTASNHAGDSAPATSAAVRIGLGIPVNTALPLLSGTAQTGRTLTCSTGSWSRSPSGFAFAWLRDGTPIAGATASSYVAAAGDAGHAVGCRVVASNEAGAGLPATSATVAVTSPPGPSATTTVGGFVAPGFESAVETSPKPAAVTLTARADTRGRVAIRVSCACSGTVAVRVRSTSLKRARLSRGSATVTLTSALRRQLKRNGSLKATVSARLADGRTVSSTLTIR